MNGPVLCACVWLRSTDEPDETAWTRSALVGVDGDIPVGGSPLRRRRTCSLYVTSLSATARSVGERGGSATPWRGRWLCSELERVRPIEGWLPVDEGGWCASRVRSAGTAVGRRAAMVMRCCGSSGCMGGSCGCIGGSGGCMGGSVVCVLYGEAGAAAIAVGIAAKAGKRYGCGG